MFNTEVKMFIKKYFSLALISLSVTLLPSCSKNNVSIQRTMTAKVNGFDFNANVVTPVLTHYDSSVQLNISGYNSGTGQKIVLVIPAYLGAQGTYSIDAGKAGATYTEGLESDAIAGQVVISNITTNSIQGSFNFVTNDSVIVTGGNFNVAQP